LIRKNGGNSADATYKVKHFFLARSGRSPKEQNSGKALWLLVSQRPLEICRQFKKFFGDKLAIILCFSPDGFQVTFNLGGIGLNSNWKIAKIERE
jgi:hypothetical protein